jgi:hypothetical protein
MGQHWCLARTGRLQLRSGQCWVKQLTWPSMHTQLRQTSSFQAVPCPCCVPQDLASGGLWIAVGSGQLGQHWPGWWVGCGQGVGRQWCTSHSTRPRWHRHRTQASRGHVSPSTRYTPSTEWHTIACCSSLVPCSARLSSAWDISTPQGQGSLGLTYCREIKYYVPIRWTFVSHKLHGLSPQANYTDWETAACRWS